MSSADAAAAAVAGAHTVFLVTNFWESMSSSTEEAQGRAVADACKAAGVQHLIFSSLLNTTEASGGKLPNISHFDGKARIEAYIRSTGVPSSFFLPGMFMSNFVGALQRRPEGEGYILAVPEGMTLEGAKAPLFDVVDDTGRFCRGRPGASAGRGRDAVARLRGVGRPTRSPGRTARTNADRRQASSSRP